jgi:uncharacterized membrane protein HdeD (DUF308 family)
MNKEFWTTLWRDDDARHLAILGILCATVGIVLLWPLRSAIPIALGFVLGIMAGVGGMASVMTTQERIRGQDLLRRLERLADVQKGGQNP